MLFVVSLVPKTDFPFTPRSKVHPCWWYNSILLTPDLNVPPSSQGKLTNVLYLNEYSQKNVYFAEFIYFSNADRTLKRSKVTLFTFLFCFAKKSCLLINEGKKMTRVLVLSWFNSRLICCTNQCITFNSTNYSHTQFRAYRRYLVM